MESTEFDRWAAGRARTSRISALLTLLGAIAVLGTFAYSSMTLVRLNREVHQKTEQVHALEAIHDATAAKERDLEIKVQSLYDQKNALEAQRDDLMSQRDGLEREAEKLRALLSVPGSADAIASILATMAERPVRERAEALYRRGQEVSRIGNIKLGEQLFEAAVGQDSTYVFPQIALATLAWSRGDRGEAERRMIAAATADPTSPWPVYNLINFYMAQGKADKARVYAERLRKIPDRPPEANDTLKRYDAAHPVAVQTAPSAPAHQ